MTLSYANNISNLSARLDQLAHSSGQRLALRSDTTQSTYLELHREVRSAALWLAQHGISKGHRVILSVTSGKEVIVTVLACARIGAIYVPVSPLYSSDELGRIALSCDARAVIGTANAVNAILNIASASEGKFDPPVLVVIDSDFGATTDGTMQRFSDLLTSNDPEAMTQPMVTVASDLYADFALVYTSGTSGNAKAMLVNQFSGVATGVGIAQRLELTSDDVMMSMIPMISYINLCCAVPAWLSAGCTLVIPSLPPDYAKWIDIIDRFAVTFIHGVPTHYVRMLAGGVTPGVAREIKGLVSGAECPPYVIAEVRSRMGIKLCNHYGLAEFGGVSVVGINERDPEIINNSVGEPFEWVELRICDEADVSVSDGNIGEIQVRGPGAMRGYYGDGDLLRKEVSKDGWIKTGDLGRLVDRRNLQLVGRASDMMIRAGNNVHPSEVESAFLQLSDVDGAVAFGIPDSDLGEAICVCIVVPKSSRAKAVDLIRVGIPARLVKYKWPDFVVIIDEIPTNLAGKALRRALRDRVLERELPLVPTTTILRRDL